MSARFLNGQVFILTGKIFVRMRHRIKCIVNKFLLELEVPLEMERENNGQVFIFDWEIFCMVGGRMN